MKKHSKLLLCLASTLLLGGSLTALTGCGGNTPSSSLTSKDKYKVTINAETIVLDTYSSFQLEVKTDYTGTVEFESTDEAIASVDATGLVTSYGYDGECKIKVKVDTQVVSLKTMVSDQGNMPILELEESDVPLLIDETVSFEPKVSYKNQDVTAKAELIYKSEDTSIVSVSKGDNGLLSITGVRTGTTNVNVKASVYGKTVAKEIKVTVNAKGYVFMVEEGYDLDIESLNQEDQNTTVQLHASVFKDGRKVEGAIISYESLDSNIATISASGLITAKKVGNGGIRLSYNNGTETTTGIINVHIGLSNRKIAGVLNMEVGRDYNNVYVPTSISGTVESISWDGQNVAASYNSSNKYISITGSKSNLVVTEAKAESELTIYTTTCRYTATVNPYTMIIKTPDDIEKIRYRRDDGWSDITKATNIVGYYILGNDIDFSSHTMSVIGNNSFNEKYGFLATFDGKGHTLKNIKMGSSGNSLFGSLAVDSVVKNVNFTGVEIKEAEYNSLLAVHAIGATISNVNIELATSVNYSGNNGAIGVIASRTISKSTLSNITINAAGLHIANLLGNNGYNPKSVKNFVVNAASVASVYYDEKDTVPHKTADGVTINIVD